MAIDNKGKRFAAKLPTGIPEHLTTAPNRALKKALQVAARREGNADKAPRKRKRNRATVAKAAAKVAAPASSEGSK